MEMIIRDHWDMLSPETRQWLTDNPGCVVLPRTITERIHKETGITPDADRHSQVSLSPEDVSFILAKAEGDPVRPK